MSTYEINPDLLIEIQKYGAFDVSKCYNCGTCTATCNLTSDKDGEAFPRKFIRYAQVGVEEKLLSSKEIWLCAYCSDCSATCPRQAEPGEFMAAVRRYTIAKNDVTGFSSLLYKSKLFASLFVLALGIFLWFFIPTMIHHPDLPATDPNVEFFNFFRIDFHFIHIAGLILAGIVGLFTAIGMIRMFLQLKKVTSVGDVSIGTWFKQLISTVYSELVIQTRFNDCDDEVTPVQPIGSWYTSKWIMHLTLFWGFAGLFAATGLNYMFKDPSNLIFNLFDVEVPIWSPIRLLGTLSGIAMMYGASIAIIKRLKKDNKYFENGTFTDWLFLGMLFFTGLTGFFVEISVYTFDAGSDWIYYSLLLHIIVAAELLFLAPFNKFAHAIYRPLAIWMHNAASAESN